VVTDRKNIIKIGMVQILKVPFCLVQHWCNEDEERVLSVKSALQ
jgi:hypothetical protein